MEDRLQRTATALIVGANDSDGVSGGTVWARVAYGFFRTDRIRKNQEAARQKVISDDQFEENNEGIGV